jgi:hypothetical protein
VELLATILDSGTLHGVNILFMHKNFPGSFEHIALHFRQRGLIPAAYAPGIFLVALAVLMQQIIMTRIFSVILYYHYAYATISLTMLGMTIGAMIVFRRPVSANDHSFLAVAGISASLSSWLAIVLLCRTPLLNLPPWGEVAVCMLEYLPSFTAAGVIVTLILTRSHEHVNRLYAADMLGAACGCPAAIVVLDALGGVDGLIADTLLMAFAACILAWKQTASLRYTACASFIICAGTLAGNLFLEAAGLPHLQIKTPKDLFPSEYESWTSYSRVLFSKAYTAAPFGWGMSLRHPYDEVTQRMLTIDAGAGAAITRYDGNIGEMRFLQHDIVNAAYHVRPVHSVAAIGVGGGRDILSAKVHGAERVIGVEVNGNILRALTQRYGDFSGHLDRLPGVTLVNDEARSYLARSPESFDLIQVSLIDTWAATAAGAMSLTENVLYTVEGWRTFFSKLSSTGMLSFSRWYRPHRPYDPGYPDEVMRMLAVGHEALMQEGIVHPESHFLVVSSGGVATLIISKPKISRKDADDLHAYLTDEGFAWVYQPFETGNSIYKQMASGQNPQVMSHHHGPVDLSPATDDRPFFFNMMGFPEGLRLLMGKIYHGNIMTNGNNMAMTSLLMVLGLLAILSLPLLLVPLCWCKSRPPALLTLYLAMIGLGFMTIEIALLQRLMIFLGHPTYALTVILFTLLLSSGAGSLLTGQQALAGMGLRWVLLLSVMVTEAAIGPVVLACFRSMPDIDRIAVAIGLISPMGLMMGMCFPLGMAMIREAGLETLMPWLWGVNGVMSVMASTGAVILAMSCGIAFAFWCGVACYAIAAVAAIMHRRPA